MKKIILSLLTFICFQTIFYGQLEAKSEKKILKDIDWISTHPVQKSDKEFVSKSADIIMFQFVNHPDFQMNYKAFYEFMSAEKNYKYYDEIGMVYMSNQLANRIQSNNKYDLTKSSLNSLKEVIDYYKILLEKEPNEQNSILDKYLAMTDSELKNYVIESLSE